MNFVIFAFRNTLSVLSLVFFISCGQKPATTTEPSTTTDSLATQTATAIARPVHWGYEGDVGPSAWASLSPAYGMCAEGKHQSPVNIVITDVTGGTSWSMDYKSTSFHIAHTEHMEDIVDNGHTIQITVDEGSTLTYGGKAYNLKQFHFHTPSEHTLDGKNQPMEMHMVHQSEDGSLAVLGVLFKEGKTPNPNFAKIIANLPNAKGESKHLTNESFALNVHLPTDHFAYHYTGSFTTPPCTENVQWLVLREMISLTKEQISAFSSRIGPNNRPTQSLNDRKITMDDISGK